MGIGLGKVIYDKESGSFRRVGLTEEEERELSQELRNLHVFQMRDCIDDALCVLPKNTAPSNLVRVACAFFAKRAPASFTVQMEALDRKVHEIKNGNGGDNHD